MSVIARSSAGRRAAWQTNISNARSVVIPEVVPAVWRRRLRLPQAFHNEKDPAPKGGYRPELDGLRGIAVLAVMAFHFGIPGSPMGFLGVDVFFVLSGFLITGILVRSDSLGRFYLRRAIRLVPAFALMLAFVAWSQPVSQTIAAATYTENLSAAFGWQPMSASLGHTWSLAAEWQFYLVWPVALLCVKRRWSLDVIGRAALILGLISAAWQLASWNGDWARSFTGPDTHAAPILIGCALALGIRIPFPRWGIGLILVPLSFGLPWLAAILPASLATAAIIQKPPAWLAFRPLVWVGMISYGLYLWHVPIVNQTQINAAGMVVVTLVTFVAAGLSYRYVEAPLLRLGRSSSIAFSGVSRQSTVAGAPDGAESTLRARTWMPASGIHVSK